SFLSYYTFFFMTSPLSALFALSLHDALPILICFVGEEYDTSKDLLLFDPNATWKKTRLAGGTYTMKEILKPIFIRGECKYQSPRSEEHTSELQSRFDLVCRLLLEKKKTYTNY